MHKAKFIATLLSRLEGQKLEVERPVRKLLQYLIQWFSFFFLFPPFIPFFLSPSLFLWAKGTLYSNDIFLDPSIQIKESINTALIEAVVESRALAFDDVPLLSWWHDKLPQRILNTSPGWKPRPYPGRRWKGQRERLRRFKSQVCVVCLLDQS